jgi:methylisocitrate lyase
MATLSPGAKFRAALKDEKPLQCICAINAYHARMAERTGYKANNNSHRQWHMEFR